MITVPTAERITRKMDDCKFSCQNNIVPFKEWMNAILTVTETDALLERSDGCK